MTTRSERYIQENFDSGTLKPLTIGANLDDKHVSFRDNPPVFSDIKNFNSVEGLILKRRTDDFLPVIKVGSQGIGVLYKTLEDGDKFSLGLGNECDSSFIYLLLKNERLYIVAEFKDLQTEQYVGSLEYNKWRVFLPNLLSYRSDPNRLEVRDKENNIICSIVSNGFSVTISGYYISQSSILVVYNQTGIVGKAPGVIDTCFSKSDSLWKNKAQESISQFRSAFLTCETRNACDPQRITCVASMLFLILNLVKKDYAL